MRRRIRRWRSEGSRHAGAPQAAVTAVHTCGRMAAACRLQAASCRFQAAAVTAGRPQLRSPLTHSYTIMISCLAVPDLAHREPPTCVYSSENCMNGMHARAGCRAWHASPLPNCAACMLGRMLTGPGLKLRPAPIPIAADPVGARGPRRAGASRAHKRLRLGS